MSRRRDDPQLPVGSVADIRLAEAVVSGECPVCVVGRTAADAYLASLLNEGVTDPRTRRELRIARGFCRVHSRALLQTDRAGSGGALGAGIFLHAALGWRLDELEAAREGRGRSRRRRDAARRAVCPVCAHAGEAGDRAAREIGGWLRDEQWRARLAEAAFCADDLVRVWEAGGDSDEMDGLVGHQLDRMRRIRRLVDRYVHHSSQDRRHLQTDEERRAVDRAARLLGGDEASG